MPILMIRGNLTHLRVRLALATAALGPAFAGAIINSGTEVAQALAAAAPTGTADTGTPPAGDAPGRLRDSFHAMAVTSSASQAETRVVTTQPTKLRYVRYGTGIYGTRGEPIVPVTKKALMWPGAQHPVRSVRGIRPNEFVTPVLQTASEIVVKNVSEALNTQFIPLLEG